MDKNMFDKFNKEYEDAFKKVRDIVNSEEFRIKATMMGIRLTSATKKAKGRVSMECDAPRCMIELGGNEALLIVAMQQLIEKIGVEETLGLIVANCFVLPKTVSILHKEFESAEEKEVFKRVMNMSEEEREKIKNEL